MRECVPLAAPAHAPIEVPMVSPRLPALTSDRAFGGAA